MLKVNKICKSFADKKVLNEISFTVKKGKIVALLGENGAGKSTLMRILSGFYEAESGDISIDGINLRQRVQYLQKIGYVQEVSALYDDLCVYDYLLFIAMAHQIKHSEIQEKIQQVVTKLQLKEVIAQKNYTLSKGFKKRVELAAVLLAEPQVLFLDEPTEGLDPNQKIILRGIIKEYAKENSVLISTHTLEDVDALADDVLLLHKGELKINESLSEFKKDKKKNLLQSFQKATED